MTSAQITVRWVMVGSLSIAASTWVKLLTIRKPSTIVGTAITMRKGHDRAIECGRQIGRRK